MKTKLLSLLTAIVLLLLPKVNFGQAPTLGTTSTFAIFTAAGALNNGGASYITGDIGSFTATQTGFPGSGSVTGNIYNVGDPILTSAMNDVATAYSSFPAGGTVLGTPLENQTLTAGVYASGGAASLDGNLTLDGGGDPNALFIIKINGALTIGATSTSHILLTGSAALCNVYWQVGGEFTLTGASDFWGTVIVDGALSLNSGTLHGRALSKNGDVNCSAITVTIPTGCASTAPSITTEPADKTACSGSSGSFTVVATGTTLTYQWRKGTTALTNGGNISGATTATLTINPVSSSDAATNYNVVVTGAISPAVTSTDANLVVNPLPAAAAGSNVTICINASTVLGAAAVVGSTYSWTSSPAGFTSTAANPTVTPLVTTTYTVVETITATGCTKSNSIVVTVTPSVGTPVFTLGATSTRGQAAGSVTYTATATHNSGITYTLDAASVSGGNSIVAGTGVVTYDAGWSGTSVITATASGCNGPTTATHTVTINPPVGTPVFNLGSASSRDQGAGTLTYTATATNTTGITYTLDATSVTAGNSIVAATGAVTYTSGWSGTSVITASAAGYNGPTTATHTVTINPSVGTPVFTLGSLSTRGQGAGTVTYTATASNSTGVTYSLDVTSLAGGNSINASTGEVTYVAGWSGTSVVTATAVGTNGPSIAIHTVTTAIPVGTPVFTLGTTSTVCQGANSVTYSATATNNTGITYSLDAASLTGGNTINAGTGLVTYAAGWTGTSIITASAAGYNGPTTATHTVTINPTVGAVVFTLGATSSRCQGAGSVTYTATATNSTGITYSLDAASLTGGNSIDAGTGTVTYAAGWSGTSIITASATGCNGPVTATHTATTVATVGTPVMPIPSATTICQGSTNTTYTTSASNATSYTWTVSGTGNSISGTGTTGTVTWNGSFTGKATVSVNAAGCNGPSASASTTVMVLPTPTASISGTTSVCQNASGPGITFSNPQGMPVTITYNINGANQATVNVDSSSTTTINAPTSTGGTFAYNLVSVAYHSGTTCSSVITGTATVTVNSLPTAASGLNRTVCLNVSTILEQQQ